MSEFAKGVTDFFLAYATIVSSRETIGWYIRRLFKAIIFGTVALGFYILALGFSIWSLIEWVAENYSTLNSLTLEVLATVLVTIAFVFLTAGPWMYLSMALFLTTAQDWEALVMIHPRTKARQDLQVSSAKASELLASFLRSILLAIIIVLCGLLSLIPIFLPLAILVNSFAIGREWLNSSREAFPVPGLPKPRFSYAVGMGFLPALVSSIPIVGILELPVLQMAAFERALNDRQETPNARKPWTTATVNA